ncbi:neutral zinc metallopeptidase [Pseudonocardia humida]|uniref:Neutral zinc metallopeptidase n=1 Tax=Pseudonocardia humida TaxID=2800819 RepID=A0ABT1A9T8_9PSEU|nr:neutral zinc metallopeptidase [Pseudonocardia humida]MCO1659782.1 neutral zinc metallopeptidase [Pseudonocardia humida]
MLLSGCSAEARQSVFDTIRDAVDQAKQRRAEQTGDTPEQPGPTAPLGTDGRSSFDYTQYQNVVSGSLALLEDYWAETLPTLGGTYSSPRSYTYYRSDEGSGPSCGGQPAPARNAFYCPAGDFIAWDETGLLIPYYVSSGDFAASFVLAHEFGHAMQARLGGQERYGVLRELQADCFAGAWSRWVSQRGLLEAGDLDEATLAVISARDVPSVEWTDPAAHGSGFERTRAFGDGFEAGAQACYPAPAERWVLSRG